MQSDESVMSVERNSTREQVDQNLRNTSKFSGKTVSMNTLKGKLTWPSGDSAVQRRLSDAKADMEIRRWEQRKSEVIFWILIKNLNFEGWNCSR